MRNLIKNFKKAPYQKNITLSVIKLKNYLIKKHYQESEEVPDQGTLKLV